MTGILGLFAGSSLSVQAVAPTDIILSNNIFVENDDDGGFIGDFTGVDADPGDSFSYQLVNGVGSTDNHGFSIYYDQLLLNYEPEGPDGKFLDFEKKSTYSIRIKATDSANQSFEKVFVLTMIDDETEDVDNDGYNEVEETGYGTLDTKLDTDGDGFNDWIELHNGSSPLDVNAWPNYSLVGWGDNSTSELRVPDIADFSTLSTGQVHNLGLKFNGTVAAWGSYNDYGQINPPVGLSQVVQIAAGGEDWNEDSSHSVALKSNGTLVAWGFNDEGYLTTPVGLAGVIEVSAGRVHNVALKSDGTVTAWGNNHFDQTNVPVGLQGVISVSAGGHFSLALKKDGTVVAWGRNFNGVNWEPASVPAGLRDVVAISAGRFHSLALKGDGTVVSWGYGQSGQTTVPSGLSGVVAVRAGGFHSLALKSDGSVVAWGLNLKGQTTIPLAAQSQVVAISAGLQHSLAIRQSAGFPRITSSPSISATPSVPVTHQIVVANATATQFSAIGLPTGLTIHPTTGLITGTVTGVVRQSVRILVDTNQGRVSQDLWIRVFQGVAPTAIALSPSVVMENSAAGVVVGNLTATDADSGDSSAFELVDGTGSTDNSRFLITGNQLIVKQRIDRDFEQNAAGFSIRVRATDASLNPYEAVISLQFADDLQEDVDKDGLIESQEILAGTSDLVYDSDHDGYGDGLEKRQGTLPLVATSFPTGQMLIAWGKNDRGQLTVPLGLGEIRQAAAGWAHSLALKADGTVAAWGWNLSGQSTVPAGLTGVVAISAGYKHSLALKSDGTVVAWGDNSSGQSTVPGNLSGVVAVSAGGYFSLALKSDGSVVAWGDNANGETVLPPGLANVVSIAAGGFHGLALKSDGTVATWGWSGATTIPAGVERVVAIAAGAIHSVALKSDDTVVAWGVNENGQLDLPAGIEHVADIGAGCYHGVVLKNEGTLVSWGCNDNGQTTAPIEAANLKSLAVGAYHNLAIRQATGFPALASRVPVLGAPGQPLSYQMSVSGATAASYSAMGLPAGLTINSVTGLVSGTVGVTGERRSVRITVETNKGRLSQILWFNTADGYPPTGINLSGAPVSVMENSPAGTVLGTFIAVDPDPGDTHVFEVTVLSGTLNPYCLAAVGNRLEVASSMGLNFENGASGVIVIRVRARDSGQYYYDKNFSIQLLDDLTEDEDGDGASQAMENAFQTSDQLSGDFVTFDADHDGLSALLEFAFNLNAQLPDAGRYLGGAGSTSGLPLIETVTDAQGQQRLRLQYLRRLNSGLSYIPQFSSGMNVWANATAVIQVTPINTEWERCQVDDTQFTPSPAVRFARVGVRLAPAAPTAGSPPTGIEMVSATLPAGPVTLLENRPVGTVVANLSAADPDPGDTHTFSVTVIAGSSNPNCLGISGNHLVVSSTTGIDFETSQSLTIRVTATDSTLKTYVQNFTIPLLDDRTEDADADGMNEATEEDILFTSDLVHDSFSTADADSDGVPTLIEYAFNLNPQAQDAGRLLGGVGSISGLPLIYPVVDPQGQKRLRIEYLQRIGSGLSYVPQFSSSLSPAVWVAGTHVIEVTNVNTQWERCVIDDYEFTPSPAVRFGRVKVSQ